MAHPARAARLWLAVAVATLWLVSVGGAAEDAIASSTVLDVTALIDAQRRQRRATRLRLVSVFRRGWITILVALLPPSLPSLSREGGGMSRCVLPRQVDAVVKPVHLQPPAV